MLKAESLAGPRASSRFAGSAALCALAATLALAAPAGATQPRVEVRPSGLNGTRFSLSQHDYVSRCSPGDERVTVEAPRGWLAAIGHRKLKPGSLTAKIGPRPGKRVRVRLAKRGSERIRNYDIRCLPEDFPGYSFHRDAPGGPRWFSMQLGGYYGAIFDRAGVPVWWYHASGEPGNIQVLPDGTVAFDPVKQITYQTGDYEIRTLAGRLLRVVRGAKGTLADIHEIQLLKNGNYLIGAQDTYPADTSAYGGSADSSVIGIEIQEMTPEGKVVWRWDSRKHIGLDETGRWWDRGIQTSTGYDIVHWNSADVHGRYMYLSFRHLDAVYKVDRRTGRIVWKLGGTETPKSLDIRNDPHGDYPLGGQHDARLLPDGTISIHDNETGIEGVAPRIVRYRVDEEAGTARLVDTIEDPDVPSSFCCGSARQLDSGGWLIGWGGNGIIGGYDADGNRLFDLTLDLGFSYRAIPVPGGTISKRDLRRGMDRIAQRGRAG